MKKSYSYYDLLGIRSQDSDDDIKRAYLKLAKKYHPDNNPQNQRISSLRFQKILEAYNAIKTREKRAIYNQKLRTDAQNDNHISGQNNILSKFGAFFKPNTQKQGKTE